MGEDSLKVELPKPTGEASGSVEPPRRVRRLPVYERIEPLRPTMVRHLPLLPALRPERARNPANHLPQLQPIIPHNDPFTFGQQHPREVQGEQRQQRAANPEGLPKIDDWIQAQRAATQQRVLLERFAERNLRALLPAAAPEAPIPRPQENRAGGVKIGPADRERVDQWRRTVVDPGDEAAL